MRATSYLCVLGLLLTACSRASTAHEIPAEAHSCPWGTRPFGTEGDYEPTWCELPFGVKHGPMHIPHFDEGTKEWGTIEWRYFAGVRL